MDDCVDAEAREGEEGCLDGRGGGEGVGVEGGEEGGGEGESGEGGGRGDWMGRENGGGGAEED